jgi:hypothetical protein
MAYGELKVDSITFTNGGTDTTVSVSGLVQNPTFSGDITVTGTISGDVVLGGTTVSGATVTGVAGEFGTVTGNTAGFTTVTGTTVSGSTANFVSGTFTTQVSGVTVTGNLAQFTTITGGTAGFTTVTGTTVTGSAGQFGTVTGNTAGFTTVTGTTVTGTTASFTSGVFTNISGGTHTITSGVFDDGTAAAPSITFTGDLDTGIYSPGANQVAISTNGQGRLFLDASGNVNVGLPLGYGEALGVRGTFASQVTNVVNRITEAGSVGYWGTVTNHDLAFQTSGQERLRITADGKLGLGTSAPGATLDISAAQATVRATSSTGTNFVLYSGNNGSGSLRLGVETSTGGGLLTGSSANSTILGSSSNHPLHLGTNATTALTVDTSQRVGIGTTSALAKLHVSNSGAEGIEISPGYATNLNYTSNYNRSTSSYIDSAQDAANHRFYISGTERARIDSSGRLLVGTSSARSNFTGVSSPIIQSTGGLSQPSIGLVTGDGATTPQSYLIFGRTADGGTGNTLVGNNFKLGSISFQGADGSNLVPAAEISAAVDGTPGASDMPGRLVFSTTADGSASPTERMRLDSSGRLGLGTSSPQERLDVAGNGASFLRWEHDGASGSYGSITSGGVLRIGPYFAATDRELALYGDNASEFWVVTGVNKALHLGTNKTSRIYIGGTGKVGVGTTSPAVDFDVAGKIRTSTGILFGSDTAAANTLDDYEEGTWTPAFSFATPGDLAVTYSSQTGNYRIVGKLCIATFTLEFTPTYTTSSGTARVTGLPLSTGNYLTTPASVDRFSGFTLTAGFDNMWLRKNTSQTYVELYSMGRSGSASMGTSEVVSGSAKILNGTIIYNL